MEGIETSEDSVLRDMECGETWATDTNHVLTAVDADVRYVLLFYF